MKLAQERNTRTSGTDKRTVASTRSTANRSTSMAGGVANAEAGTRKGVKFCRSRHSVAALYS